MKKIIVSLGFVFSVLIVLFSISGCQNKNDEEDELVVYTSFYPLYDMSVKILKDKGKVINIVPSGEEAHHYEPTSKQVAEMESADLIIINGLDMEHWAEELPSSITSKIYVASENIETINLELELVTREDPHVWTSIKNFKKMMENVKNKLSLIDEDNAAYYHNNYLKYAFLLDGLDSQFQIVTSQFVQKNLVVTHQAFGYLVNDYGLTQMSISGIDSDGESDPQTVAQVIDFIQTNNVKVIYYQEFVNSQIAQAIASQTSAKIAKLSTIESLTQEQINSGEDYLSVMAQNLVNLQLGIE